MLNFIYMYFDFIVYSFGGWIAQGFYVGFKDRKFLNTGFLYGPYVPIYGFGALAIIYIIDAYLPNNPFAIFWNYDINQCSGILYQLGYGKNVSPPVVELFKTPV